MRTVILCPLCGYGADLEVSVEPKLIHSRGNGRKGFLTADVGIGGVEHTCGPIEPGRGA